MSDDNMLAGQELLPPVSGRAKGGMARANSMTAERRKAVAAKAAAARWSPTTTVARTNPDYTGILRIGDREIACAVLPDGRRVLSRVTVLRAMGRTGKAKGGRQYDEQLPVFLTADNLQPYITQELRDLAQPIPFKNSIGYRAELLPKICLVFIDALEAGVLKKNQIPIAEACKILYRGLADVGVIALVDEATGYQVVRDRDELEKILAAYVNPELLPWAKRFGEDYYKEAFRLFGWTYSPPQPKRPRFLAWLTDDLIYKKLPPGVRDKLREKNPADERGRRKHRNHQFLTSDIGEPHLQSQITAITTLMRASRDLKQFKELLARAYPKDGDQLTLPISEDTDEFDLQN